MARGEDCPTSAKNQPKGEDWRRFSARLLIRIIKTGNHRLWIGFGILAGLGLENKYSMLIFGGGIVSACW
jgi:hypothetical protein